MISLWVGCSMIGLSSICLLVNVVVLSIIAFNPEFTVNSSYKIMLLMGFYDITQLSVHFITGLITVFQFEPVFWVSKVLGIIISPSYESYVFVTMLLACNRFVLLCCPWYEQKLFSATGNKVWIGLSLIVFAVFALPISSNQVHYHYSISSFHWYYDTEFRYSNLAKVLSMYYQIIGMFVAWSFYVAITIGLIKYRKKVTAQRHYRANRKILFQAFVLTVYCTIQNVFWHKGKELLRVQHPQIRSFVINMMWIGNGGINAFICIVINNIVQKKLKLGFARILKNIFGFSAALFRARNKVKERIVLRSSTIVERLPN